MAFKLSKTEHDKRDELISKLNSTKLALETAIEVFNSNLNTQSELLDVALTAYNQALSETQVFVDEIASRAEDEIGEKSEKWQESEGGQAAQDWQNDWSGASSEFDPVEIEFPEQIDPDLENHADILDDLPTES